MAIHKLSDKFVTKVAKDGGYGDGGNLWLQVTNKGAGKSWLFRWTVPGTRRERVMGLGPLHTVDIDQARDVALACRKLLAAGKDPLAERVGAKLEAQIKAGSARTVQDVHNEFYDAKIKHLSPSGRESFTEILRRHALGKIGGMPIAKVTRATIFDTVGLRELWERRHPTAEQLLSYLQRMFKFAIASGYREGPNPLDWDTIQHMLPDRKRVHKAKHHATLPWEQIPAFMRDLRAYKDRSVRHRFDEHHPTRAYWLEFVVLSGVRVSEARSATWDEFEDITGTIPTWRVPTEHHKIGHITGQPHIVPVSRRMQEILIEMGLRQDGIAPGQLVFPSPYESKNPRARRARSVRPFDVGSANTFIRGCLKWDVHITAHGFRQTFTNWAVAAGMPPSLIEFQVGHIPQGKVAQAYHTDPQVEARRPWMEDWGKFCSLPPADDNVVNLPLANKQEVA
jgi:integrase